MQKQAMSGATMQATEETGGNLSRRPVLAGLLALGACTTGKLASPFSSGDGRPAMRVPRGACDSHIHILDPRFPPTPGWRGGPVDKATVAAYRKFQARIGTDRVVIVTPSTYGTDNRATLDALAQFKARARGVAVIDCYAPLPNLDEMARLGIKGFRVNFVSPQPWGKSDVQRLKDTARIAADRGWHIQIYARSADFAEMEAAIAQLPVSVVVDHLASIPPAAGVADPGHQAVLRLLANGRTWLKLSGAYISSKSGAPEYADLLPIARSYVSSAPQHLVWGSDWPHRGQSAHWPDDAGLLDLLAQWAPDESTRRAILVDNPKRLYGFD